MLCALILYDVNLTEQVGVLNNEKPFCSVFLGFYNMIF